MAVAHHLQLDRLRRRRARRHRSRRCPRSASRSGSGSSRSSSAAWPSPCRRCSAGPGSAGVAGIAMVLLWIMNGLNVGGPLGRCSARSTGRSTTSPWSASTTGRRSRSFGIVGVVFLAIGVELFTRRDLGVTAGLSLPGLPAGVLASAGRSAGRSASSCRGPCPGASASASSASCSRRFAASLADQLAGGRQHPRTPSRRSSRGSTLDVGRRLAPALRGAAVHRGRLRRGDVRVEVGLGRDRRASRAGPATPLPAPGGCWPAASRRSSRSCLMTVLFAAGIGLGGHRRAASTPGDAIIGSAALGLYAVAIVGVGVAIGGLWRTSIAAEIAAVVVVVTYLHRPRRAAAQAARLGPPAGPDGAPGPADGRGLGSGRASSPASRSRSAASRSARGA